MGATDRIINGLVPEFVSHQQQKAKDYNSTFADGFSDGVPLGFENADVLGLPGQFAEIWRKIWKLKRALWDGSRLVGEQPREILLDLIGHAFLAIDMIDRKGATALEPPTQTVRVNRDGRVLACGPACSSKNHLFAGECLYRRAGDWLAPAEGGE
jgi:hypothetical protein